VITREPAGNGGFGYDPIFFVPSEGKTAAELTREEKVRFPTAGAHETVTGSPT
jgi:inosine/xanthosine triphosphate pyrophosphatase family protein